MTNAKMIQDLRKIGFTQNNQTFTKVSEKGEIKIEVLKDAKSYVHYEVNLINGLKTSKSYLKIEDVNVFIEELTLTLDETIKDRLISIKNAKPTYNVYFLLNSGYKYAYTMHPLVSPAGCHYEEGIFISKGDIKLSNERNLKGFQYLYSIEKIIGLS